MALNADEALQSTSCGMSQIMGFNAVAAGCANVNALVAASQDSEDAQLRGDWTQFALHYNGTDFQKNKYDQKLDLFHKRYLQGPMPDLTVRGVQLGLMVLGYGGNGFVAGQRRYRRCHAGAAVG